MTMQKRKIIGYSAALLGICVVLAVALTSAGSSPKLPQSPGQQPDAAGQVAAKGVVDTETDAPAAQPEAKGNWNRDYSPYANRKYPTHVYFGDTHHHTANSGDAFMDGDRLGPEDSYRFARGEQVTSSSGVPVKLSRPLDFLVDFGPRRGSRRDVRGLQGQSGVHGRSDRQALERGAESRWGRGPEDKERSYLGPGTR